MKNMYTVDIEKSATYTIFADSQEQAMQIAQRRIETEESYDYTVRVVKLHDEILERLTGALSLHNDSWFHFTEVEIAHDCLKIETDEACQAVIVALNTLVKEGYLLWWGNAYHCHCNMLKTKNYNDKKIDQLCEVIRKYADCSQCPAKKYCDETIDEYNDSCPAILRNWLEERGDNNE